MRADQEYRVISQALDNLDTALEGWKCGLSPKALEHIGAWDMKELRLSMRFLLENTLAEAAREEP